MHEQVVLLAINTNRRNTDITSYRYNDVIIQTFLL